MRSKLLATGSALLSFAALTGSAVAAPMTAKEFAEARLAAFGKGDVEAIVAQYSETAMVITPMGLMRGKEQIRPMIEGIIGEFGQPGATFNLVFQAAEGDVVTFVWHAETAKNVYDLGVETYVLKDGLAEYQTFAAKTTAK